MANILVFAEFERGELRPEFWELMTVATELGAADGAVVHIALAGWQLDNALELLGHAGAAEVHLFEDERLADPWPEGYTEAFAALCSALMPEVVLMPRTPLGVETAARLAIRLGWSLLQDVTSVEKGPEGITAVRPVFGGAVSATVVAHIGPWIVVPRPRAFEAAEPQQTSGSALIRHDLMLPAPRQTHCGTRSRQESSAAKNIERARVLVAGGAGLGGPEPFIGLLDEIAELLGGAVAASRVACDSGWVPTALQVGLTGKTVAPDLYLAIGISGASQHLAGCASAQAIAVVNTDESAPFFQLANYGVVGDWKEVLPGLRDALKEKLQAGKSGV